MEGSLPVKCCGCGKQVALFRLLTFSILRDVGQAEAIIDVVMEMKAKHLERCDLIPTEDDLVGFHYCVKCWEEVGIQSGPFEAEIH